MLARNKHSGRFGLIFPGVCTIKLFFGRNLRILLTFPILILFYLQIQIPNVSSNFPEI
jgi:hypothetical protein